MDTVVTVENLDSTVLHLIARIERHSQQLGEKIPAFEGRILRPRRALRRVHFSVAPSEAAFEWREAENEVILNAGHVAKMMSEIEAAERSFAAAGTADRARIEYFRNMAVEMFVVHEVTHIGQGVPHFSAVQILKDTEGELLLGKLDIDADVLAAKTLAWLQNFELGDGSREEFVRRFGDALYFLTRVCIPAFGVTLAKRGKLTRALGLFLMFVRAAALDRYLSDSALPVEAPLMPVFSADCRLVTLSTMNPELEILRTQDVEQAWAPAFAAYVAEGNFDKALDFAVRFANVLFAKPKQ
jgi:hypothetical protein